MISSKNIFKIKENSFINKFHLHLNFIETIGGDEICYFVLK
ncbi:hypothetical protein BGAFAR04_F0003 (plasmid) [Borreliella garinii Far04]|nr:hypothetical protein BGAFAR04_F0003 [Borreliella garinii Far04]